MKRFITLAFFLPFILGLLGQTENWQVYSPANSVTSLSYSNSNLWVVTAAGIMRWNQTTNIRTQYNQYNTPYPSNYFKTSCTDMNSNLWVGGLYGAMRFNGTQWDLFDVNNSGLLHNDVIKIVTDHLSAVWFATPLGVARYYQGNWQSYNSANSSLPATMVINDMAVDPSNGIWLATESGAFCFDGTIWHSYTTSNSTLPYNSVKFVDFKASGQGWFGFEQGIAMYVSEIWVFYTSLSGYSLIELDDVYIDSSERVWLYNNSYMLCFDAGQFLNYPITLFGDNPSSFCTILVDDAQNIWLGVTDYHSPCSLIKFDGSNYSAYPHSAIPLASNFVTSIFKGFDNKFWLSTSEDKGNGGFFSLDDGNYEIFGQHNLDMPCPHVWALAQDQQLNMWVSTCLGLLRTGPQGSEIFNSSHTGLSGSEIQTICAVSLTEVWIGNVSGVSRYSNGVWTLLSSIETGMNLAHTKRIKQDPSGRIWIGGQAGLCSYFEGEWTTYTEVNNVHDIAFGRDGAVWVAEGELSCLQDGQWTHYDTTNSDLLANNLRTVAVDQNEAIWAGTYFPDCVVYKYADGSWTSFNGSNSPLSGNSITNIYVDANNTKWIGSKYLFLFNENGIPVSNDDPITPVVKSLGNYPNPFRGTTTIRFNSINSGTIKIRIYNLKGQQVWQSDYASMQQGTREINWDGKDVRGNSCAAGVYMVRVIEGAEVATHKVLKLK